jgi:hypothetical protein
MSAVPFFVVEGMNLPSLAMYRPALLIRVAQHPFNVNHSIIAFVSPLAVVSVNFFLGSA